ncbi:hypothetical protein JHK87_055954 [Glycine soja]|nr:hypothetical protein JHK87_055954 [Glycine soja]
MARAPDNIKSINGSKETLKLVVRITDLWFVGTFNRSEQAEMVITDSHGDAIYVVCKQDQLKSWKTNLMENCTYVMHNFKVMKNDDIIGVVDEVVYRHVGSKSTRVVFKLKDLRYRLEVMVNYKEESTKFLLWDCECTELIGPSANEVNKLKIEEGDVDLNVSPQALDKLLGYVLAFKVKVQPKFNNVVVLRYSNDIDLINDVVEMLPDAEAISKVHGPIFDSDNPPMILPNLNLMNRKRIIDKKRQPQAQAPPQPIMDSTSQSRNYHTIESDSSEDLSYESTQGSDLNFSAGNEDCQSSPNDSAINTEASMMEFNHKLFQV